MRRGFSAFYEKPPGGGRISVPPVGARVKVRCQCVLIGELLLLVLYDVEHGKSILWIIDPFKYLEESMYGCIPKYII